MNKRHRMKEHVLDLDAFLSNADAELEAARWSRAPRILTRDGEPVAAVLAYDQYLAWRKAVDQATQEFLATWKKIGERNKHISEEEIEREVRAAIAEVRAEQRARGH